MVVAVHDAYFVPRNFKMFGDELEHTSVRIVVLCFLLHRYDEVLGVFLYQLLLACTSCNLGMNVLHTSDPSSNM